MIKIHIWIRSFEEITKVNVNKVQYSPFYGKRMDLYFTILQPRYIFKYKITIYWIINQYFIISRKMEMRDWSTEEIWEMETDLEAAGTEQVDKILR